jgi:thiol-disulfide isomerase/thioredoxin
VRTKPSSRPRRSSGSALRVAAAVLSVTVVAGCGAPTVRDTDKKVVARENIATGLTRWEPAQRPTLPRLQGATLDGGQLDVAGWRGHVVVVNAWGSWCGPCREEAPALRRVWAETTSDGVRFVGIDTRDNAAAARAFTREFRIGYSSLVDDSGRVMLAFARTIPVSAVPSTVVVDARGRIAARIIGAVRYPTLRGLVDDTLAETIKNQNRKTPTAKGAS